MHTVTTCLAHLKAARTHTHTYTHFYAHSSVSLAECWLLDSSGMAKTAHPSALCLSNAVTGRRACVCVCA